MMRIGLGALLGVLLLCAQARATDADMEVYGKAIDWLVAQQHDNGAWGPKDGEIGITALVVRGLAEAPQPWRDKYRAAAEKGAASILQGQQENGSFTEERGGLTTYRTAMAIMALESLDKERYADAISKAAAYLKGDQFNDDDGVHPDDPHYGGWGYSEHEVNKPDADLSNTHMAIEALRDAGIPPDDPVFKRAMEFITRCQNSSETNPGLAKLRPLDDGGFIYDPGSARDKSAMIENDDGTHSFVSYASMTYAGLMSMLHADVPADDPRMKAALGWIANNYTLEENKGLGVRAKDPNAAQQGLYYYYHTFAKALAKRGEATVETNEGTRNWARDLFDALEARVKDGGFFQNENSRWWEQDPVLVTAYAINAMNFALPYLPKK